VNQEPRVLAPKYYLGDGVSAEFDGHHVILTTDNGMRVTNTIYLEERVIRQLLLYLGPVMREFCRG
jgi:hypothetical protein